MELLIFLFVATIAILGALFFVLFKNPLYSVLSLIVTFFSIAGLYILLNAQFLGIVQIIVYAGAIMVLFLYVLMMLNVKDSDVSKKGIFRKGIAFISGGILLVSLVGMLKGFSQNLHTSTLDVQVGLTKNLGRLLFTEYVLPFELASILILSGIVGAVLIGKKDL